MPNNIHVPERRALSVEEAARAVGISRATLYRLVQQKRLATVKIGSRRLVPVSAIDSLLKRPLRNEPVPAHQRGRGSNEVSAFLA
jgi:excisionase family DNA binding protein